MEFVIWEFFSTEADKEEVFWEEVIEAEVMDSWDEFSGSEVTRGAEDDDSGGR
jgi:hypothetical protein